MKLRFLLTLALGTAAEHSASASSSCDADEEESALLQTSKSTLGLLSHSDDWDFQLLDVGAPRTGTQSMYVAFQRLGYKPCHTGIEGHEVRTSLCKSMFGNGSFDDVVDLMKKGGWDSGMEEPLFLMYKQFMVRFPEAKFVLPMRDAEDWYQSYMHYWREKSSLEQAAFHIDFKYDVTDKMKPEWEGTFNDCVSARYFGCDFTMSDGEGYLKQKKTCIDGYNTHVKRVQQLIPPARLLLFDMSDGYEPLCEFLGKPLPTYPNGTAEPFPHDDNFGKDPTKMDD